LGQDVCGLNGPMQNLSQREQKSNIFDFALSRHCRPSCKLVWNCCDWQQSCRGNSQFDRNSLAHKTSLAHTNSAHCLGSVVGMKCWHWPLLFWNHDQKVSKSVHGFNNVLWLFRAFSFGHPFPLSNSSGEIVGVQFTIRICNSTRPDLKNSAAAKITKSNVWMFRFQLQLCPRTNQSFVKAFNQSGVSNCAAEFANCLESIVCSFDKLMPKAFSSFNKKAKIVFWSKRNK